MDKQQKQELFLIVVFGLPASGKTTFTKYLHQQIFPTSLLISADTIELQLASNPQLIAQFQKLTPEELLTQLQKICQSKPTKKAQFNNQVWKQARQFVQYAVEKLIKLCGIIVDDDLLLRSQRKVYRKISWSSAVRYVDIFMDCSVSECLQNLKIRNESTGDCVITEQVIRKAADKLQIEQDKHLIKIKQQSRKNINKNTILTNLHIVQIIPNDPNNPNDPNYGKQQHKPKYQHTSAQLRQLQARSYIHQLLKLSKQQLIVKFGSQLVETKKIGSKNILATVLANWKKIFVKQAKKQQGTNISTPSEHFSQYLNKL